MKEETKLFCSGVKTFLDNNTTILKVGFFAEGKKYCWIPRWVELFDLLRKSIIVEAENTKLYSSEYIKGEKIKGFLAELANISLFYSYKYQNISKYHNANYFRMLRNIANYCIHGGNNEDIENAKKLKNFLEKEIMYWENRKK